MKLLKITAAAACVFFLLTAAYAASAGKIGRASCRERV